MPSKTIVLDVDGVVSQERIDGQWVPKGVPYGARKPYPQAVKTINKLYAEGWEIVLLTARYMERIKGLDDDTVGRVMEFAHKELEDWCRLWGINFSRLQFYKPSAVIYVDNNAYRLQSELGDKEWDKFEEFLANLAK